MRLAVYDLAVRLSQLLGANRRYIDAHPRHIGKLRLAEIGDVINESEVVVGLSGPGIVQTRARRRKTLRRLVEVPRRTT
jgi:GDP-mannose 6-dehydrogenase